MPNVEDGYTRIANELLEAILAAPFTLRELKVMLAVMRMTYGWQKTEYDMTFLKLASVSGVHRTKIGVTVSSLVETNCLNVLPGDDGYVIGVQKQYVKWDHETKRLTRQIVSNNVPNCLKTPRQIVSKTRDKLSHIKETEKKQKRKTKETAAKAPPTLKTPDNLNSSAWAEYIANRKAMKVKALTPAGIKKQQTALAKLSHANQQRCVDDSIKNGWQGLFPEKSQYAKKAKPNLDDGQQRDYAADADSPDELPDWARSAM